MVVQLTPQAEELLRQIAAYGEGRSDDELIEEALRLLEAQRRYERLKDAVAVGFASLDRGESAPFTPELRDQMRQRARQKAADPNWQPDHDVQP
jgi:Arc/MetJ-type ribon-helix-helix transcriptional regulator